MSDTPRTDECIVVYPEENAHDMYVWADFARKLERENVELRAALEWIVKRGWNPEGTTIENACLAYESFCQARAALSKEAQP